MKILYGKLNINSITGNQLLWKNVCALFSNKTLSKISKTTLLKKGEIVTDDTKILFSATESKHFFKKLRVLHVTQAMKKMLYFEQ